MDKCVILVFAFCSGGKVLSGTAKVGWRPMPRYQPWVFQEGDLWQGCDMNGYKSMLERHTHTHEAEAWASLPMMRTGSCHRLFIPCMSPMARNKLATALSATVGLPAMHWALTGSSPSALLCICICVCVCV